MYLDNSTTRNFGYYTPLMHFILMRSKKQSHRPLYQAVFHIERDLIGFNVPIYLRARDFDNSEMVRAARNSLHRMFVELADQSKVWDISPAELERISKINVRSTE